MNSAKDQDDQFRQQTKLDQPGGAVERSTKSWPTAERGAASTKIDAAPVAPKGPKMPGTIMSRTPSYAVTMGAQGWWIECGPATLRAEETENHSCLEMAVGTRTAPKQSVHSPLHTTANKPK